jgi:hypothetical protein
MRSAIDGAAQDRDIADRPGILARQRADELDVGAGRDGDVAQVEVSNDPGRSNEGEQAHRILRIGQGQRQLIDRVIDPEAAVAVEQAVERRISHPAEAGGVETPTQSEITADIAEFVGASAHGG